jgi:hypothetical protein
MIQASKSCKAAFALGCIAAIAACGDGDSGTLTTPTTFSGTAATGAAMAGAAVSISCASGSGTATTSTTGSYTTAISGATLPCVLKATSSDGNTVLYSVTAASSTGPQVANITPLTHLLVASLAGTDPATFFAGFNATTASTVTSSSVSAAQADVLNTLSNAGVNTTGLTDLLGGSLVAGSGSGYDGVLDALAALQTSTGTTLAQLTTTVAASSPAAPITSASNNHTPSLPASLLLKTAASNCSALRSGDYVVIQPQKGVTITDQVSTSSFNASTLTWTDTDGTTNAFTSAGTCQYTEGGDGYAVSQAGIIMGVNSDQSVAGLTLAFPKQTIAVADLAGSWIGLGFQKNNAGTAYVAETITTDVSSSGTFTNVSTCIGAQVGSSCSTSTTTINISSNSAGGFDWVGSGTSTWTERAFAYRAGSGDLMLVTIGGGGSLHVWNKQRTLSLPTVGAVVAGGWYVRMDNQWLAGSLTPTLNSFTVNSVDTAAGSYERTQNTVSGVPDYLETVFLNTPLAGYNLRNTSSVTSVFDSRTVNLRERTSMPLRGMGVSFQSFPTINSFQMSIDE